MENVRRCNGCMELIPDSPFCGLCGHNNNALPENPIFIKPGTVIEGYQFGKVLGHGGFGITYLGYDLKNDRKVAIKEYLPAELATRKMDSAEVSIYSGAKEQSFLEGIEKFKKEAELLQKFNDFPGIVDGYDLFESNHTVYFVMEYIEGITLKEYVAQKGGRIPFEAVRAILMPVIDALAEMHRKDIIHRDISPDNIYITKTKQVKLLDFGAARQTVNDPNKGLSVILKHGFTPKEQYFTKGNQGPWTDVYALGATAYYLLTGTVPQSALDRLEVDKLVPLTSYTVGISGQIDYVIRKALAVEEFNRYQTVNDLKQALLSPETHAPLEVTNQQMASQPIPTGQPTYTTPVSQPASHSGVTTPGQQVTINNDPQSKKSKFRMSIVAIAIVAFLVIGGVGTFLIMPKVPDITGMTVEEAMKYLENKSFKYDIAYSTSERIQPGDIIEQSPSPNKKVFKKHLEIEVSVGPEHVKIPTITGMDEREAVSLLTKSGFQCEIETIQSINKKGTVAKTEPAMGVTVRNGTRIVLYISEGPNENWVVFEDSNFEAKVREIVGVPSGEMITKEDVKGIKDIYLSNANISSLEGIQDFVSLENLYASSNNLKSVPDLPKSLNYLNLNNNNLSELDVAQCTNLQYLYVFSNELTKLPNLPTSLEVLDVYDNKITDISGIEKLVNLDTVDLSFNEISDFSPLYEVTWIRDIDTSFNKVEYTPNYSNDWAYSITSTNKETFAFQYNFPDDHLEYTNISKADISEVASMTNATYYGKVDMGPNGYETYSLAFEDGIIDFYFDSVSEDTVFFDIYGPSLPLFGEYDIWCEYDDYQQVLYKFDKPTTVLIFEDSVIFTYTTRDVVYAFVFNNKGVIDYLRVINRDYLDQLFS